MKCKLCDELMFVESSDESSQFDGVVRIYKCSDSECGETCQAYYDFEHITPDPVFWKSEMEKENGS